MEIRYIVNGSYLKVIAVEGGKEDFMGAFDRAGDFYHGQIIPRIPYSPDFHDIVARKGREIREHGVNPPGCKYCGGTPRFPQIIPEKPTSVTGTKFERHLCTADLHQQAKTDKHQ